MISQCKGELNKRNSDYIRWSATPRLRSGVAARRSYLTSEDQQLHGQEGGEELLNIQGQEGQQQRSEMAITQML